MTTGFVKGDAAEEPPKIYTILGLRGAPLDYASLTILVKIGSAQGESRQNGPADPPGSEICLSFPSFVHAGLDMAAART